MKTDKPLISLMREKKDRRSKLNNIINDTGDIITKTMLKHRVNFFSNKINFSISLKDTKPTQEETKLNLNRPISIRNKWISKRLKPPPHNSSDDLTGRNFTKYLKKK